MFLFGVTGDGDDVVGRYVVLYFINVLGAPFVYVSVLQLLSCLSVHPPSLLFLLLYLMPGSLCTYPYFCCCLGVDVSLVLLLLTKFLILRCVDQ